MKPRNAQKTRNTVSWDYGDALSLKSARYSRSDTLESVLPAPHHKTLCPEMPFPQFSKLNWGNGGPGGIRTLDTRKGILP